MKKISNQKKAYYSGIVKKTIVIKSSSDKVWKKISNVVGLPEWLIDVKKTVYLSKIKKGIGVIRKITFDDGNQIEEHVVAWKNNEYFSYLALNGMPLRVYHATISIKPQTRKSTLVTWQTYLNSKKMTKNEFKEFKSFLEKFYQKSLRNLKLILEK
ncbi:MAG TPA: SRPBCC family protein [Nitrosopumilaceae archaeon]|nr:SRPBCC family protein [Nitrosopumilaceae archaeon]